MLYIHFIYIFTYINYKYLSSLKLYQIYQKKIFDKFSEKKKTICNFK